MSGAPVATATDTDAAADVRRVVEAVPDPELPLLTLGQLGVIRSVCVSARDGETATATVEITPTYSGCPALEVIQQEVARAIRATGLHADVRLALTPPWSTDWITAEGRKALSDAGIAPPHPNPNPVADGPVAVSIGRWEPRPACPRCGSAEVEQLARFGGTACLSMWRCLACREPFDYVKPR